MREEVYEPSLDKEIVEQVRKLSASAAIAGVMPEGVSRLRGAPPFDLERVEKLVRDSIDLHIHPGPDPFERRIGDQIDLAIDACRAGMKGLLFKSHHVCTAATQPLVQKVVNEWADEHRLKHVDVFGGVVLNYCVGGLNPEAVVVSARLGGRVVWPPNVDSKHYRTILGVPGGIAILDENGDVVPSMKEILSLIKEGDLILSMSCLSVEEVFRLIDEAVQIGVKRMSVIHPNQYNSLMTVDQMKQAAEKGAWIELTCASFQPSIVFSWDLFMQAYHVLGADRIIAASDSGIFDGFRPVEAFRHFITGMLTHGIPDSDVAKMIKTNPAELIYP